MAALGAAGPADQPVAGTPRRIGQGRVHDLHKLEIARRKLHNAKDTGLPDEVRLVENFGFEPNAVRKTLGLRAYSKAAARARVMVGWAKRKPAAVSFEG